MARRARGRGLTGRLFEVTPGGDLVWVYVNPFFGPPNAPPRAQTNPLFRAYRYTSEQVARARATLVPTVAYGMDEIDTAGSDPERAVE